MLTKQNLLKHILIQLVTFLIIPFSLFAHIFIPEIDSYNKNIPNDEGEGIRCELFHNLEINENSSPLIVLNKTPLFEFISPVIDFPIDGQVVSVENTLQNFFSDLVDLPDSYSAVMAKSFILRSTALLKISKSLDLDLSSPKIDISIRIASDDGNYLTIGNQYIGQSYDMDFIWKIYNISFESEGLFPLSLIYFSNDIEKSGIELQWKVKNNDWQVLPQTHLYQPPDIDAPIWFDSKWNYRIKASVCTGQSPVLAKTLIKRLIDFDVFLYESNVDGILDQNSIKVTDQKGNELPSDILRWVAPNKAMIRWQLGHYGLLGCKNSFVYYIYFDITQNGLKPFNENPLSHEFALVSSSDNGDGLYLGYSNGDGSFSNFQVIRQTGDWDNFCIADFDGDTDYDFAVTGKDVNGVKIFYNRDYDSGNFLSVNYSNAETKWSGIKEGDFNEDGLIDIAYHAHGQFRILINKGNRVFEDVLVDNTLKSSNSRSIAVSDFNSDGHMDVILGYKDKQPDLFVGNGSQIFQKKENILPNIINAHGMWTLDYDSDGDIDIIIGDNNNSKYLYQNNGELSFSSITIDSTITNYFSGGGSVFDWNNDGFLDISSGQWNETGKLWMSFGTGQAESKFLTPAIVADISEIDSGGYHMNWGGLSYLQNISVTIEGSIEQSILSLVPPKGQWAVKSGDKLRVNGKFDFDELERVALFDQNNKLIEDIVGGISPLIDGSIHSTIYLPNNLDKSIQSIYLKLFLSDLSEISSNAIQVDHDQPDLIITNPSNNYNTSSQWTRIIGQINDSSGSGIKILEYSIDDGKTWSAINTSKEKLDPLTLSLELSDYKLADFESGYLDKQYWQNSRYSLWQVSNTKGYNGSSYSLEAPVSLNDNQTSGLIVNKYCQEGEIRFWLSVDSEPDFDFLEFYIDGVKMDAWSGLLDWTQEKFMVTKGMHSFEWVYNKDSATSIGKDTAWIDDIIFPENYIINIPNKNIALENNGGRIIDKSSNFNNASDFSPWGASNLIDGKVSDNQNDGWATNAEGESLWVKIGFKQTYLVDGIELANRVDDKERNKCLSLEFSDSSKQEITLENNASLQYFSLIPVKTEWVKIFVETVYSHTNNGFQEIMIYSSTHSGIDNSGVWFLNTRVDENQDIRFRCIDGAGHQVQKQLSLYYNQAKPTAKINIPLEHTSLNSIVDIYGQALSDHFISYTLSYISGIDIQSISGWNIINTKNEQVEYGLLGTWNNASLKDDLYTIKLEVASETDIQTIYREVYLYRKMPEKPSYSIDFLNDLKSLKQGSIFQINGDSSGFHDYSLNLLNESGKILIYGEQFIVYVRNHSDVYYIPIRLNGTFELGPSGFGYMIDSIDNESIQNNTFSLSVADFTSDGQADFMLTSGARSEGSLYLYKQIEPGLFEKIIVDENSGLAIGSCVGDFDNNSKNDIIIFHSGQTAYYYKNKGNNTFEKSMPLISPDGDYRGATSEDFNNDSYLDIIVTKSASGDIFLFKGYGDGTFAEPRKIDQVGNGSIGITAGDFDNDDQVDFIINEDSRSQLWFFGGLGNGFFRAKQLIMTLNSEPESSINSADINCDGNIDLIFGHNNNGISWVRGTGDGTFADITEIAKIGFPLKAIATATIDFRILSTDINLNGNISDNIEIVSRNNETIKVALSSCDKAGNCSTTISDDTLVIDNSPPAITIKNPGIFSYSDNKILISGTADDEQGSIEKILISLDGGLSYTYPATGTDSWSCTISVSESLDYTIVVRAFDSAGNYKNTEPVTISCSKDDLILDICYPEHNQRLRQEDIEIKGTASGKYFSEYFLEYKRLDSSEKWKLIHHSKNKVNNDLLGIWLTDGLNNEYIIRLVINNIDGFQKIIERKVYIDTVLPLAPIEISALTYPDSRILISWSHPQNADDNEIPLFYNLYRRVTDSQQEWQKIASHIQNLFWIISESDQEKNYQYALKGLDKSLNESELSQVVVVYSFLDQFPNDPAASLDTDHDGYPDKWDYGKNSSDSTSGLIIDAFPKDPAAALDTDKDGLPDDWNPAASTIEIISSTLERDNDDDNDGLSDNEDLDSLKVDADDDGYLDLYDSHMNSLNLTFYSYILNDFKLFLSGKELQSLGGTEMMLPFDLFFQLDKESIDRNITIDKQTGLLTWRPETEGTFETFVTVSAYAGSLTIVKKLTINVSSPLPELEINDSVENAQILNINSMCKGDILNPKDIDIYKVSIYEPVVLRFKFIPDNNFENKTKIELFDSSEKIIDEGFSENSSVFVMDSGLPIGDFFIRIKHESGTPLDYGIYTYRVADYLPQQIDDYEKLVWSETVSRYIINPGIQDKFQFNIEEPHYIKVNFESDSYELRPFYTIQSLSDNSFEIKQLYPEQTTLNAGYFLPSGSYLLSVSRDISNPLPMYYNIMIENIGFAEVESNNDYDVASDFYIKQQLLSTPLCAQFKDASDKDYYKIYIDKPMSVDISFDSTEIDNYKMSVIFGGVIIYTTTNKPLKIALYPGIFYLLVESLNNKTGYYMINSQGVSEEREFEPNNRIKYANALNKNQEINGFLYSEDDIDYIGFKQNIDGWFDIDIESEGQLRIRIIDESDTEYLNETIQNEKIPLKVGLKKGSNYYLEITGQGLSKYKLLTLSNIAPFIRLVSVEIVGPDVLEVGQTQNYTCFTYYSDGSKLDSTSDVGWSLSEGGENFVTLHENGSVSANAKGEVIVYAEYAGETARKSLNSMNIQHYGNLILFAGVGSSVDEIFSSTQYLADHVYEMFKYRLFNDLDIYYINSFLEHDINDDGFDDKIVDNDQLSYASFEQSIEWAKQQNSDGPLFLYIIGHGKDGKIKINDQEDLLVSDLNALIINFQNETNRMIVLIIEACKAGSFIDGLKEKNRIIITSVDKEDSPTSETGKTSFSQFFMDSLALGRSIRDSFNHAKNSLNNQGLPYSQMKPQLIEDQTSTTISDDMFLGGDFVYFSHNIKFINTSTSKSIEVKTNEVFFAELSDLNDISNVWARILPEDLENQPTINDYEDQHFSLEFEKDSRFQGTYSFNDTGQYRIMFYAQNKKNTVIFSPPIFISVGKTYDCSGDVNGDERIDLYDAILGLQVMSYFSYSSYFVNIGSDVNINEKIGLEEILYILGVISN